MNAAYLWEAEYWASDKARHCDPQLHSVSKDLSLLHEMQKRG